MSLQFYETMCVKDGILREKQEIKFLFYRNRIYIYIYTNIFTYINI